MNKDSQGKINNNDVDKLLKDKYGDRNDFLDNEELASKFRIDVLKQLGINDDDIGYHVYKMAWNKVKGDNLGDIYREVKYLSELVRAFHRQVAKKVSDLVMKKFYSECHCCSKKIKADCGSWDCLDTNIWISNDDMLGWACIGSNHPDKGFIYICKLCMYKVLGRG